MSAIFKKLNYSNRVEILLVNAPESFEPEVDLLKGAVVRRSLDDIQQSTLLLAFVTQQDELDDLAERMNCKVIGDAVVWFAYPKASSKKYRCEFNRDTGWAVLGRLGFEGVRQVSIDENWSVLRFRRVEFIKTMVRDRKRAMSDQGKKRVSGL